MRIGLVYDCVYPYTLGGVEHRNADIVRRLNDQDELTIYGFDYWRRDPSRKLTNCRYVSVGRARDVHASAGKRRIADSLAAAWGTFLALLFSRDEVWDITNIAVLPTIAAWLAARLRRRALVVTWQEFFGREWDNYLSPRLGYIARRLERFALDCSPLAIAASPQTRDRLLAAGFPPERLRYIPNGISTKVIEGVRPFAGSADLVFAGRLVAHRRVDLAIRALHYLRQSRQTATLWIIGDGPERFSLEALCRELNVSDVVTFHGFLPKDEEVFARMKACRVAVLPSAREGFGLTAVQAWACGLPVVVCDDAENATAGLVTDARLGSVVPAKTEPIADAASHWLDTTGDTAWRIAHAREHYDLDRMVAAVRTVYEEAIRRIP